MNVVYTPAELLADRLRKAAAADPELFAVSEHDCSRIATLRKSGKAARLDQLLANGAWTDAALTMLAMELPGWTLRRLVHEDDEWICSLSQQPNLPSNLDDTVDFNHSVLPVAILGALTEARARASACLPRAQSVPEVMARPVHVACCDNFA